MTDKTEKILDLLEDINKIPRKSGDRTGIHNYFKTWAVDNDFEYKVDEALNLLIKIPATSGFENGPVIVLQGHMDMVCEKTPESNHDFSKDPITHLRDGDWLSAKDTSLGADNGIGLAMAMVVATDSGIGHPQLELLFTTDEEVGLWGADEIKPGFVTGKVMLNIDSEEQGIFTVGCAGAAISHMDFKLEKESVPGDSQALSLSIGGFKGGHSGCDISKNRGNTTAELVRGLSGLFREIPFKLTRIEAGSAMNAISRSSRAVIVIDKDKIESVERWWKLFSDIILSENETVEKNGFLKCEKVVKPEECIGSGKTIELLDSLRAIPHGVQFMDAELPEQVETSLNFGVISMTSTGLRATTMQRSSVKSRMRDLTDRIETIAKVVGAEYTLEAYTDPWQPEWSSPLIDKCSDLWKKTTGENSKLEVTHGALECGVIGNLSGGMDMISFGPDIEDPHSPDERLKISSVGRVFDFLSQLLTSYK